MNMIFPIEYDILAALDDFSFSIPEYARDEGIQVKRLAKEHVSLKLARDDIPADYVSMIIQARYNAMLEDSVHWIKRPVRDFSQVMFETDGRLVTGSVNIEPKHIGVELLLGDHSIHKETVLQDWSPRIYTEKPIVGSKGNADGRACARRMILALYFSSRYKAN